VKWQNHKLVTFSMTYAMTGTLASATMAMIGSVLPDVLEMGGVFKHRTVTHLVVGWMVLSMFCWHLMRINGYASIPLYLTFFLIYGASMHVLQDSLSVGGVPLWNPYGRCFGFGLYRTRTISEEITAWGIIALCCAFSLNRGYLAGNHVGDEVGRLLNLTGSIISSLAR